MGIAVVGIRRTQTGRWQARKNIPADVRDSFGKWELKKTWDASLSEGDAKAEAASWVSDIEARIALYRKASSGQPMDLSAIQAVALAGEWYRQERQQYEDDLERPSNMDWVEEDLIPPDPDDRELGKVMIPDWLAESRDRFLKGRGLRLTHEAAEAVGQEMGNLWFDLKRFADMRASRDFRPDPVDARLPALDLKPKKSKASLSTLFEDYAQTGVATPRTISGWRSHVQRLIDHLGHDDVTRITSQDVDDWARALISKGLSPKTVNGSYLAVINIILKDAKRRGIISANPAEDVRAKGAKPVITRSKSFTDAEARTILKAALEPQPPRLSEGHRLARRWVPWVLAYTGARAGEITQLRRSDIRQEDGVWVIRITPEAGSVKNRRFRLVPLHPHLLEMGFHELGDEADDTPVFYDPDKRRSGTTENHYPRKVAEHVATWVRSLGVEGVQPNHGWRHRFKTLSRSVRMSEGAANVLQGHAAKDVASQYGEWTLGTLRAEIQKLPAYDIEKTGK